MIRSLKFSSVNSVFHQLGSRNLPRPHPLLGTNHHCLPRCVLSLFSFFGSPDSLFSWSLPHVRCLIPLGRYFSKRCPAGGPLGCDCTVASSLLSSFQLSLFVLSSVEDSPVYLSRVLLGKECRLSFCIKKSENPPVRPGVVPPICGDILYPPELHGDLPGCGCWKA